MKKILVLAAFGAGYVLGAKAGRGRYEELKGSAQDLWNKPEVQRAASSVKDEAKVAGERASDALKGAVASTTEAVKGAAQDVSKAVEDAGEEAPGKVADVKEAVVEKVEDVKDGAAEKTTEVKEAAADKASKLGDAEDGSSTAAVEGALKPVGDDLEAKGVKDTGAGDVVFSESNSSDATHERTQAKGY